MEEEVSYESIKELFTEYLKKHNHRKTSERYAILEQVYSYEGHFNADVLFNTMRAEYRVSRATVYNTLDLLQECKLIIKHQLGGQFAQYEKTFGSSTHHHLICTNCGNVKEFSDEQLRMSIQKRKFPRFHTSHYSLYIYGLCHKCKVALRNS